MNTKIKYVLGFGITLVVIKFLVQILINRLCTSGGLGCLTITLLFETPGLIIGNLFGIGYNSSGLINMPLYFIVGGLIGLIVYKIRNKK